MKIACVGEAMVELALTASGTTAQVGFAGDTLNNSGVLRGALKCGEGGPESLGDPVKQEYPAAETVVDTTAAGDSFNGGYLAALLTGADQKAALMAGHMLARKVVGTKGAIIPKDVDI